MTIRRFTPADAAAVVSLFRNTVRRVNLGDYTPEQVRAWAPDEISVGEWAASMQGRFAVVAESGGILVGFADLAPDGHLDRLYVHADRQREGIGRALLAAVVAEAERRGGAELHVEASITALPFFRAHGFVVVTRQTVVTRGVAFVNYRMVRAFDGT